MTKDQPVEFLKNKKLNHIYLKTLIRFQKKEKNK